LFTSEPSFSALALEGKPLGRVYGVWGLSDDDIYVALGVETSTWPNTSLVAAVAHWNGANWTLDPLPPVVEVVQITGRSGKDLWLVAKATVDGSPVILRKNGGAGWAVTPLNYGLVLDMTLFGQNDGLMSASPTRSLGQGVTLRLTSDWTPMPMPSVDETYLFWTLRARDEKHVYATGYTTGATMGKRILGAFDGAAWTAARVPAQCGEYLSDVVGVAPDVIYTNATSFTQPWTRHICRVSADLATWDSVAVVPFSGDREGAIVATGGATVVAIWSNYMTSTAAMVTTVRANTATSNCSLSPPLGNFVAWSAKGSPNVHIFTGEPAGRSEMPGRHLVKRFDP
jgi:hypothetical protein